jgi:hypothetical protein
MQLVGNISAVRQCWQINDLRYFNFLQECGLFLCATKVHLQRSAYASFQLISLVKCASLCGALRREMILFVSVSLPSRLCVHTVYAIKVLFQASCHCLPCCTKHYSNQLHEPDMIVLQVLYFGTICVPYISVLFRQTILTKDTFLSGRHPSLVWKQFEISCMLF